MPITEFDAGVARARADIGTGATVMVEIVQQGDESARFHLGLGFGRGFRRLASRLTGDDCGAVASVESGVVECALKNGFRQRSGMLVSLGCFDTGLLQSSTQGGEAAKDWSDASLRHSS
jgi:hypothetical protein